MRSISLILHLSPPPPPTFLTLAGSFSWILANRIYHCCSKSYRPAYAFNPAKVDKILSAFLLLFVSLLFGSFKMVA